jgi:pyrroline-5-carboxylate reductase
MQVELIGAGNTERALARGWGDPVLVSDGGSGRAKALVDELGGEALHSNAEVAEREVDSQPEDQVMALFGRLGTVVEVSEKPMGAAGAVMGVGPACQALLVEAQVDAAVRPGGTTARGLAALERGGVRPAFQDAFDTVVEWSR